MDSYLSEVFISCFQFISNDLFVSVNVLWVAFSLVCFSHQPLREIY